MKRFKFYPAAVLMIVAVLCSSGFSAAAAKAPTRPAAKITCKIPSITLSGVTFRMVKPSCKLGTKPLKFTTTWTRRFGDLLGPVGANGVPPIAPWSVRPASGKAAFSKFATTTLPSSPPGGGGYHGSMLPGYTKVTFTIAAKSGKKKGSATKTWTKINPNTHVLGGPPPKVTATPGSGPPVCILATQPTSSGLITVAPTVSCVGGEGNCHWVRSNDLVRMSYLMPYYIFKCAAADRQYDFAIDIKIEYGSSPGAVECPHRTVGFLGGSFIFPSSWGKGFISYSWAVGNYTSDDPYPEGSTSATVTIAVNGITDPCTTDLK